MTPHIEAKEEDIAKTVIMAGDPKRIEYIANKYLTDVKCINTVRNMLGFTGFYKGKRLTVMSHGMGNPSMGIYSYELFNFYNVDNIIRVGTAGSYSPDLDVYDVLLVEESYSDSAYAFVQNGCRDTVLKPSAKLNERIRNSAEKLGKKISLGRVYSSDVFYKSDEQSKDMLGNYNCLAVEMETFALFHNAKILGKNASCILTISDSFVSNKVTTSEEREKSFNNMIEIALESIL